MRERDSTSEIVCISENNLKAPQDTCIIVEGQSAELEKSKYRNTYMYIQN